MEKRKLIVVGAGPGGYAAAFLASDLGIQTTLIDTEINPGGVCLYRGCIPSKALLHAANLIGDAKAASEIGIDFAKPKIDLSKLRSWKDGVVRKLTSGLGTLCKQRKTEFINGRAKFLNSETVEVTSRDGKSQIINFEYAIIATGSYPAGIPGINMNIAGVMDSTSALEIENIPKSMLVIGGGYIGLELGSVYASLGTKITVAEMLPAIMNGADADLVSVLSRRLNSEFESILLETKVTSLEEHSDGVKVSFEDKSGKSSGKVFEKVLVCIGRKPNSSGLGLENTKVKLDQKGFIVTDIQRRTDDRNIFAIGDVAGEPMLAHKASHEGRTAVEVIAGHKAAFEPLAIPAVVFTDPEIAWCGITEAQLKAEGRDYTAVKFPWAASGRALTIGRTDGLTKLIIENATGRILGAGIAGRGAGDLISEAVLAVEMGANASDIKLTIHPHPTLSETIMESAEMFFGQSTHIYKPVRQQQK